MPYLQSDIPSKISYVRSVQKLYVLPRKPTDLINMVTYVTSLLIQMKKQGSESVCIISLLKKLFGVHFELFHKFSYTDNEFIALFFLELIYIYACV